MNTQSQRNTQYSNGPQWCGAHFKRQFKNEGPGQRMKHVGNRKSANIKESDDAFVISLYAAGLTKDAFKIAVSNDIIRISYAAPEEHDLNETNNIHTEYTPASFERSFQLNEKVLTENISAQYVDGVLHVTLPKNPEKNKPAQDIKVA